MDQANKFIKLNTKDAANPKDIQNASDVIFNEFFSVSE